MTTITLLSKKEKYKAEIPDGWQELPMAKFIEILKDENCSDMKFLSIISGIEEEKLMQCETKSMLWLLTQLRSLYSMEELEEKSKESLLSFDHKGITYKVDNDLGRATIGEYYSLMKLEEGISKKQYGLFPLFLATMYRPIGEAYDNEKCMEREKEFLNLPVLLYYRARNFFLFLRNASKIVIKAYGTELQTA